MPNRPKLRSGMDPETLGKMIRDIVRDEITSAFDNKLKPIQDELSRLNLAQQECNSKVIDLETAANLTDERLTSLEKSCKSLLAENEILKERTLSLENNSRKYNLRIFGLDRGVEAGKPTAFVTKLLYDLFGEEELGPRPLLSIAHRMGPEPPDGSRCMIARLYSFETKRTIQRLVGAAKGKLLYEEQQIRIFPDIPAEQRKLQAKFKDVRALLTKANVRNGVAFPAVKLLVTFNNEKHSFTSATEAMEFYDQQVKPTLTILNSATDESNACATDEINQ